MEKRAKVTEREKLLRKVRRNAQVIEQYEYYLQKQLREAREAMKPCPFCKETAKLEVAESGYDETCYARCRNCGARGPAELGKLEAIRAWDRRRIPMLRGAGGKQDRGVLGLQRRQERRLLPRLRARAGSFRGALPGVHEAVGMRRRESGHHEGD